MLRSFDNPVVGDDVVGGRVGVVGCGLGVVHDDEAVDSLVVVEVASVGDLVVVEVASVGDLVVAVNLSFTV